jgi:uncharacterized protein (UPF0335 family)
MNDEQIELPSFYLKARKGLSGDDKRDEDSAPAIGHNARDRKLIAVVEAVERLTEEIGALRDGIKERIAEAKADGYSPAVLRNVLKRRRMNADDRAEMDSAIAAYETALGD